MKAVTFASALVLVALSGCTPNPDATAIENNADAFADNMEAMADNVEAMVASSASPAQAPTGSSWSYNESKDEMRGSTRKIASISATESLQLGFPYGETTPELNIRRDPKFGFDIFITSEGQPQCPYNEEHVSVKFDNGPVREWGCSGSADGSPGILFFDSEQRMLGAIKGAKKMIVEINYYDNGRQQIVFPVAGLKW